MGNLSDSSEDRCFLFLDPHSNCKTNFEFIDFQMKLSRESRLK